MKESFYRTAMLLGEEAEAVLASAHVAVFGVGGVGGQACDALARTGVGKLTVIDSARVKPSNLNRQICAEKGTVGMYKTEAMRLHIEAVSDCEVLPLCVFVTAENARGLIPEGVDAVIDAMDNVTAKLALIEACRESGVPVICSMGAGNRLDPTAVRAADVFETSVDPLSRVMRRELRRRGIGSLRTVYSVEQPVKPKIPAPDPEMKPNAPASAVFVPAAFGLALAAEAVRIILNSDKSEEE